MCADHENVFLKYNSSLSIRDLAYEKVKETLSVIPKEVVDKVGLENLGAEEGSVQVRFQARKLRLQNQLIWNNLSLFY